MLTYYELLRRTSRTFAVGIEALPSPLRDAVTLAYLVLRVSDYFEDSPTLGKQKKSDCLEQWADLLQVEPEARAPSAIRRLADAVAEADRDLPDRLAAREAGRILSGLDQLSPELRDPIRHHTASTTLGMVRWIRRGDDFPDEEALDDYMFEVAGRVGLLLTDLFCTYSPAIERRREALLETAVSFGLGLQTVNVIRGLHEDPERGWNYVPRHLLAGSLSNPTLELRELDSEHQRRILDFLVAKAGGHIEDALTYCRTLPRFQRGTRIFCIIPALLALRTAELSRDNPEVFRSPVKVPRRTVGRLVVASRLLFFSNAWLDRHRARARALTHPGVGRRVGGRSG
ncbi:MAG: squalene/phytoene synthase family protein [Gemmatimonadota bacterium]